MEQGNNLIRENLIFLLKNMAIAFVQRMADFAHGMLNAPNAQELDWWNELSPEQQKELQANLNAVNKGTAETVSSEQVRDNINQLLANKKEQK